MSKLIICHGEENDYTYGIGKTVEEAFDDYSQSNNGEDGMMQCKFYQAEEVEIEIVIKLKETAGSAAKK